MEEKTKILEGELDNETIFPWDDVNACIDTECLPIFRSLGENKPCPICGTPSDKLKWIEFRMHTCLRVLAGQEKLQLLEFLQNL